MCAPTENISTDRIGGRACVELGVSAAVMEGRHEKTARRGRCGEFQQRKEFWEV